MLLAILSAAVVVENVGLVPVVMVVIFDVVRQLGSEPELRVQVPLLALDRK